MQVVISGISVEIQKKKIKNMHLHVKVPNGAVLVTAPFQMPEEVIIRFVEEKASWIRKQQERLRYQKWQYPQKYITGETLYIWGQPYQLFVVAAEKKDILQEENKVLLYMPKGSSTKQREMVIREWYRTLLQEVVSDYLPKWEQTTGLFCSSWQIKKMKTRWGTCNIHTGKVWLNLQLAQKPLRCLEYVILHELAHLKENNHGEKFWNLVAQHMPDYKTVRKELNDL